MMGSKPAKLLFFRAWPLVRFSYHKKGLQSIGTELPPGFANLGKGERPIGRNPLSLVD